VERKFGANGDSRLAKRRYLNQPCKRSRKKLEKFPSVISASVIVIKFRRDIEDYSRGVRVVDIAVGFVGEIARDVGTKSLPSNE